MTDRPRHRPKSFDLLAYTMALIGGHVSARALPMPPPKARVWNGSLPRSRADRPWPKQVPPAILAARAAKNDRRDQRARLAGTLQKKDCACSRCLDLLARGWKGDPLSAPNAVMILCPLCGHKRCPKAEWHRFRCTESNDVGQLGEIERRAS